jgi:hypothetical protein
VFLIFKSGIKVSPVLERIPTSFLMLLIKKMMATRLSSGILKVNHPDQFFFGNFILLRSHSRGGLRPVIQINLKVRLTRVLSNHIQNFAHVHS